MLGDIAVLSWRRGEHPSPYGCGILRNAGSTCHCTPLPFVFYLSVFVFWVDAFEDDWPVFNITVTHLQFLQNTLPGSLWSKLSYKLE